MTLGDICTELGIQPNNARLQFGNAGFSNWHTRRTATEAEQAWMRQRWANPTRTAPRTKRPAPTAEAPTTTPAPLRTAKAPRTDASRGIVSSMRAHLPGWYDLIIWTEITMGWYGMCHMFGVVAGFFGAGVLTLFFDAARATMRTPLHSVERADYPDQSAFHAAYNAAAERNAATQRNQQLHIALAAVIGGAFCWVNGQTFYAHTQAHADFATRIAFGQYTYADCVARATALLMSSVAVASLFALKNRAA